jgi:2-oxoglutarate ferredoxin oxidoreductase subunit alpha
MICAKWATPGGNEIIALVPSSVQETFELTIRAVNLSERFRVPVILLSDAHLGHMREKIRLPNQDNIEIVSRAKPTVSPEEYLAFNADETGVPEMAPVGSDYRSEFTGSMHDKSGKYGPPPEERTFLLNRLSQKILAHYDEILIIEKAFLDDAEVAVFAYGICTRSAKAAVKIARAAGMKVGLVRPITVWPFPTETIRRIAEQLRAIIVVEENLGQLVLEVERAAEGKAKIFMVNQYDGQLITPGKILAGIEEAY